MAEAAGRTDRCPGPHARQRLLQVLRLQRHDDCQARRRQRWCGRPGHGSRKVSLLSYCLSGWPSRLRCVEEEEQQAGQQKADRGWRPQPRLDLLQLPAAPLPLRAAGPPSLVQTGAAGPRRQTDDVLQCRCLRYCSGRRRPPVRLVQAVSRALDSLVADRLAHHHASPVAHLRCGTAATITTTRMSARCGCGTEWDNERFPGLQTGRSTMLYDRPCPHLVSGSARRYSCAGAVMLSHGARPSASRLHWSPNGAGRPAPLSLLSARGSCRGRRHCQQDVLFRKAEAASRTSPQSVGSCSARLSRTRDLTTAHSPSTDVPSTVSSSLS